LGVCNLLGNGEGVPLPPVVIIGSGIVVVVVGVCCYLGTALLEFWSAFMGGTVHIWRKGNSGFR
jgi:hypothetical protein